MPPLSPFTRRRIQKLPKTKNIWEGGICSLSNGAGETRNYILWIDGQQGYVRNVDIVAADSGHEAVARSLLKAMENPQGPAEPGRPQTVFVNDRELQFFLRGVLQELDVDVAYRPQLPWLDEVFEHLQSQVPSASSLPDVYAEQLCEQALALWHEAPWYLLSEQELLAIEVKRWDIDTLYVSILGMADVDYGLLFYRSLESLLQFRERVLACDRSDGLLSPGASPQMLQQIFLTQDCFFLNYEVDVPGQLEPTDYDFGSIHPLEGLRHDLDEAEAATLIIALAALNRFFKKAPDSLNVLEPITKTFRVPNPLEEEGPKQCAVTIKSLPDVSASLLEETELSLDDDDDPMGLVPMLNDDLVPNGALILLTKLTPDKLKHLRNNKTHHQPLPTAIKASKAACPVVIIQTSRPKAQALVERIQTMGGLRSICFNPGHDPFNQINFQLGIWQAGDTSLHLFHEYDMDSPQHSEALDKFQKQQAKSKGRCAIVIAAGATGQNRGNPQPKDIVGLLEVNFCAPETLNLQPLVLSYRIEP